jgi:O-antigen/teichoic acid export membrane protein
MAVVTAGMALVLRQRLMRLAPHVEMASARQRRVWLMASLPLLLLSGLEDLTSYADVLLLTLLADPEKVGVYFAAARSLALAGFVAYAMTLVAGRQFALDRAGKSRAELQRSILQATRLTFWATVVAVAATLAAGPLLLSAFGTAFLEALPVMWILGMGMILRALSGQAGEVLVIAGRQREGIAVGLGVVAVMLIGGLVLIPQWGIAGAGLGPAPFAMAARVAGARCGGQEGRGTGRGLAGPAGPARVVPSPSAPSGASRCSGTSRAGRQCPGDDRRQRKGRRH